MTTTGIIIDDFCVGDAKQIDHTVLGLPAPITSAEMGFKVWAGDSSEVSTLTITDQPSAYGQIINTGVLQTDGTYTAELVFLLTGGQTGLTMTLCRPGKPTYFYVTVYPGPYTSEVSILQPKVGGRFG